MQVPTIPTKRVISDAWDLEAVSNCRQEHAL